MMWSRTLRAATHKRSGVGAQDLGPQDDLVEAELAVGLLGGRGRRVEVDEGVDALGLLLDVVGEPTTTPDVDLVDSPTVGLDDRQVLVERRSNGALFDLGVKDDHEFVLTQAHTHLLWSSRPRSIRGRRMCASLRGDDPSMTTVSSGHSNLLGYPARSHRRNRLWT